MRYLLILIVILCSCRTRKVDTQISKSTTKNETEQSSHVKEKEKTKEVDKSVTKTDVLDKSETFETDSSTLTANKIVFDDKGKVKEATGNVNYSKHTNTRKSNNIQSTGSLQADKVKNTNLVKDSVGKTKEKSKIKVKDKVKKTEVKSASWLWLLLIPVIAGCGYLWFRFGK